MKIFWNRFLIILLSIFSFYYTNQVVDFLKSKDPLMEKIKSSEDKYFIQPINAEIVENTIRPGKKGKTIDYEKTYHYMKNYGSYNESLTILKDILPDVSIEDSYDKYVIGGNPSHKWVSLVFLLREDTDPSRVVKILSSKDIVATFFVDGAYLEKNVHFIESMSKHEFELLSYQGGYQESFFKTSLSYIESITNRSAKYCYLEEENKDVLRLCGKLRLYTIKPTLILKGSIYQEIKDNLSNSSIISMEIHSKMEKELSTTIDYIKGKGYEIVSLDRLLSE